jgi:hypothetical protein
MWKLYAILYCKKKEGRSMNLRRIENYRSNHTLVEITRDKVDTNKIHGFILGYSKELLLLQSIFDFRLDDYSIININDISKIGSGATSRFQQRILEKDGDLIKIKTPVGIQLMNWNTAIQSVGKKQSIFILEVEGPQFNQFLIGRVIELKADYVLFHHFDGAGKWNKKYSKMKYSDITRLQFNSYYVKKYLRHIKILKQN